jgi:regulator of protease activity HflC (stomatin/prohibitin superfamily)
MGGIFVVFILLAILVISIVSKGVIIVRQAEIVIIERFGRYHRTLSSGLSLILPLVDKQRSFTWRFIREDFKGNKYVQQVACHRIDLRETVYDFPRQNVITADNVVIEINAMVYFQVTDAFKAVYEINNLPEAIEKLTQTTLRNVIGELELDKTLTSREMINSKLRDILDEATDKWGVKVNRVELQDINPPKEIRAAMEKQMRAERDKRAKILEAEGTKQADILEAEGCRNAQITRAEGEARSKLLVAEAEAEAIRKIHEALKDTKMDPAEYQIALKYISAFAEIVQKGDKTVVLPYEASSLLGSVKSIEAIFKS